MLNTTTKQEAEKEYSDAYLYVYIQLAVAHNIQGPLPYQDSTWPGKLLKVDLILLRQLLGELRH